MVVVVVVWVVVVGGEGLRSGTHQYQKKILAAHILSGSIDGGVRNVGGGEESSGPQDSEGDRDRSQAQQASMHT